MDSLLSELKELKERVKILEEEIKELKCPHLRVIQRLEKLKKKLNKSADGLYRIYLNKESKEMEAESKVLQLSIQNIMKWIKTNEFTKEKIEKELEKNLFHYFPNEKDEAKRICKEIY